MKTIDSIGSAKQIVYEVSKAIVGKDEVIIKMLLAILAGGILMMTSSLPTMALPTS